MIIIQKCEALKACWLIPPPPPPNHDWNEETINSYQRWCNCEGRGEENLVIRIVTGWPNMHTEIIFEKNANKDFKIKCRATKKFRQKIPF